jgi:hypothetical protein
MKHVPGQPGGFFGGHATATDGHEHGRQLFRREVVTSCAFNEGADILTVETAAIALTSDGFNKAHDVFSTLSF